MNSVSPEFKQNISNYFEDMRVRIAVVDDTKKEIDRLIAPDFNLFSILWSDEVRLSNMIACLLNPSASHGQGRVFLDAFLDSLEDANTSNSTVEKIREIKIAWANAADDIKSDIEQSTGMIAASQRRMDIVVCGRGYGVMIENKPWAPDQKDQLKDYNKHLSNEFKNGHIMIYLSGNGTPPNENSITTLERKELEENGLLLVISYRSHLVNWLQRCLTLAEADRVRWIIKDFISYIEASFSIPITTQSEAQ